MHRCLSAIRFLALLFLPAAASVAATVTVVNSVNPPAPGFAVFNGPVGPSDLHFRVGYFINYSQPGFNSAFFQDQLVVKQMIDENFIPLGEPGALILQSLGFSSAPFGAPSNVSASQLPSGYYGAAGNIQSVTFTGGPANAPNSLGVPFGSRLFLIAYSGVDWFSTREFAVVGGTPGTTTWQVPATSAFSTSFLPMQRVDTPDEVFYGIYDGPSIILIPYIPEPGAAALSAVFLLASLARRRRA